MDRRTRALLLISLAVTMAAVLMRPALVRNVPLVSDVARLSQTLELAALDGKLRSLPPAHPHPSILMAAIDTKSLEKLGKWPWRRGHFARLIDALTSGGAKLICLDVGFTEPSDPSERTDDRQLIEACRRSGRVLVVRNLRRDDEGRYQLEPLLKGLGNAPGKETAVLDSGHPVVKPDLDGLMRRISLVVSDPSDYSIEAFSLVSVKHFLGLASEPVRVYDSRRPPPRIEVGRLTIPLEDSSSLLLNFCGARFPTVSVVDLLERKLEKGAVKDRIVIVMHTADIKEYFRVPRSWSGKPDVIPGGELHATAIHTILTGTFIRHVGDWHVLLISMALIAFAALLLIRLSLWKALMAMASVGAAYWGLTQAVFSSRLLWMDIVTPLALLTLMAVVTVVYENRRVREIFRQFVPKTLADRIFASSKDLELGGKHVEATVLFSDLRGYTNLSERLAPQQVMELLNKYHEAMGRVFRKYGGVVFDYQGDAQMVVFGAPDPSPRHAESAVRAAIDMQRELKALRAALGEVGESLEIGIGVCTGTVAYGLIGDSHHKDFAAIGDSVNTAARLQGLSRELKSPITVTESTWKRVESLFTLEELPPTMVKGKSEPLRIFRVPDQES